MAVKNIKWVETGIQKNLTSMLDRGKETRAYLNRVVYPQYQKAQQKRWMTEGASEGQKWKPINPDYAEYKLRRYGGGTKYEWIGGQGEGRPWKPDGKWPVFPGKGSKLLIATGRLVSSVIGPVASGNALFKSGGTSEHKKVVGRTSITIYTSVEYAKEVSKVRPFMRFSKKTIQKIRNDYQKWMLKGDKNK